MTKKYSNAKFVGCFRFIHMNNLKILLGKLALKKQVT